MNYQETLSYLYRTLPVFHRVGPAALKPGLGNTIQLCTIFSNPHHNFKSIHIAGTNGKGSTSHMLASILQEAGYKTGLYTSPHLKRYTERIKINGIEISENEVVDFVARSKASIESIGPSFFELTVVMAFEYFSNNNVDIAIIETGLGGRLDSTNVITPLISLITNISWDHQSILGNSLPAIASEKAGIIKERIPVIISETQPEVSEVFLNKALEMQAPIYFADTHYKVENVISGVDYLSVNLYYLDNLIIKDLESGLSGLYQIKNIQGVFMVIELLKQNSFTISEQNIRKGIKFVHSNTGLDGRWQIINSHPLTICDTAHNLAGFKEIIQQLNTLSFNNLYWVFGVVSDKDIQKILELLPTRCHYIFCKPNIPRGLDAHILKAKALLYGLSGIVIEDVANAYQWAKDHAKSEDLILIGGSTFVVAEITEI